jgi:hypothetical protein
MQGAIPQPTEADSQYCAGEGPDGVEAAARISDGVLEIYPVPGKRVVVTRHDGGSQGKNRIVMDIPPGPRSSVSTMALGLPPGVSDGGTLIGGSTPRVTGRPDAQIKVSVLRDDRSSSGYQVSIEFGEGIHIMLFTHGEELNVTAGAHGEVRRVAVWIPHDTFAPEQDD